MPPFGPSPLQSALSFPRFGGSASPFGGLGSLSDSSSPLSGYAGLASSLNAVSSSHDPFGLARPGFPPLFSSPSSSLTSPGWPSPHQRPLETKPKLPVPPSHHQLGLNTSKDKLRPPLESPSRNGGPTNLTKTNGDSNSATSSPLRPASTSSSPLVKNNDYKKDDSNEITVVGEKLNHVPNGGLTDPNRPSSSHSVHSVHSGKYRDLGPAAGGPLGALTSSVKPPSDSKTLAASLARPPVTSSSLNHPFGLASLYSGLGGPAPPPATPAPPPPGLPGLPNPYSDPYRSLGLNPYYAAGASRESLLRLNQLMMTDTERMRMGLTAAAGYPPPTPPGLYPPNSALLGGAKPPTLPGHHPSLGYPPPPPVMPGFGAVSAPSLGLPPLNGHAPGLPGAGSSSSHHHPLR